jgi:hypothetical protein
MALLEVSCKDFVAALTVVTQYVWISGRLKEVVSLD